MTIQATTLRPGLLVSLKTSVTGNVTYNKRNLEAERQVEAGATVAKWETERIVNDAAEHDAATLLRSKVWRMIGGVCTKSAFGLLCPTDKAEALDEAIKEARQMAEAFNATAKLTRVAVYVIAGRVSADDVEALKAINSEVRDLMDAMQKGLKDLDVKAIREAATKAKEVGGMLADEYQAKVQIAVEQARAAAKRIVADGPSTPVDEVAIRKISSLRTAFLDLGEEKEVAAPKTKGRKLDLTAEA